MSITEIQFITVFFFFQEGQLCDIIMQLTTFDFNTGFGFTKVVPLR